MALTTAVVLLSVTCVAIAAMQSSILLKERLVILDSELFILVQMKASHGHHVIIFKRAALTLPSLLNGTPGANCSATCTTETCKYECGNSIVEPGEDCTFFSTHIRSRH